MLSSTQLVFQLMCLVDAVKNTQILDEGKEHAQRVASQKGGKQNNLMTASKQVRTHDISDYGDTR
jgi:hypothetical protein